MNYRDRGTDARGVYPTYDASRREQQEEGADKRTVAKNEQE